MTDLLGMGGACHVRWTMRVCGYIDVHGEGARCSWRPSALHCCRELVCGLVALVVGWWVAQMAVGAAAVRMVAARQAVATAVAAAQATVAAREE